MPFDKTGKESFRSPSALNAAAASLLFVVLGMGLVIRHWHAVTVHGVCLIFVPVGIQIFVQFQRARGTVKAMGSAPVASKNAVFDMAFFAAINNLMLLVFIATLLRRIDGLF
jgi:hypothetical protein